MEGVSCHSCDIVLGKNLHYWSARLSLFFCRHNVLQLTPQYAQIVKHNVSTLLIYIYTCYMVVVFRTDTNNNPIHSYFFIRNLVRK